MTLEDHVRELVRQEIDRLRAELYANLERSRDGDRLLTMADVAELLGTTRKALSERFRRARVAGEAHPLEAMAVSIDGVRRWRRADVQAFVDALAK